MTMTLTNTCLKDSTAGNDTENAGGNAVKTASNSVPFLTRNEDGSLTWQIDQAIKEAAYPVTIYWIWPEVLESYIRTPQGYTKNIRCCFRQTRQIQQNRPFRQRLVLQIPV